MARPGHGLLRPLILAVCLHLLLQVSAECSRPSSSSSPGVNHLDDALLHHHLLLLHAEARTALPPTSTEVAVAGDGMRTGDAAAPSAFAPAVPAAVFASSSRPRQRSDRALVRAGRTPEVLLRSKLARRFLAGPGVDEAGSATDGTAPSCHSFNPHTNCPPASKP